MKKIYFDKLFPLLPDHKYSKLEIDPESVQYITTPANATIITSIIEINLPTNLLPCETTILDGTAGVGGDTISFGQTFGTVIATEINFKRYCMLQNNISVYNLYNVIPINKDCLQILDKINNNHIDVIYLDPPWGGSKYKQSEKLRLSFGDRSLEDTILHILQKFTGKVKLIVLKLPKNYDLENLYRYTKNNHYTVYLYELKKMIILLFKLS
ncbi:MAG: putative RNA methylase [Dasosvirus sp.]|uniref:Putative RNA methylase n=1 Tax=Dasosvirus sp. TaxID=2487764 RepID=A0A3G4ZUB6_9VIRU|nr:MAG: putative RNA methylase [Dasosvirus sp.]